MNKLPVKRIPIRDKELDNCQVPSEEVEKHFDIFSTLTGNVPGQKSAAQERVSAQGGEDDGQDDGKYQHD